MKKQMCLLFIIITFCYYCFSENAIRFIVQGESGEKVVEYDDDVEEVTLAYCRVKNITDLERLQNLKKLELIGIPNITSLSFLDRMNTLESIVIDACTSAIDISLIFMLPRLHTLAIRSCHSIILKNIIDLKELKHLQYLQVADCRLISFPELRNIPESLKYINVSGNNFVDSSFINQLDANVLVFICGNNPTINNDRAICSYNEMFRRIPKEYLVTY